jgi:hypothetical protein
MRFVVVIGVIGLFLLGVLAANSGMQGTNENVEKFVRVQYRHGLPYQEAAKFGKSDVPTLLRMLSDKNDRPYWSNIVLTLGIIGDESATDPLIEFLEKRFQGEVDLDTFNALLTVPAALGHSAYRGNTKALGYLLMNYTVDKFAYKRIAWQFQKYKGETLSILLCKMIIRGLAVSGNQRARDLLVKMQTDQGPEYAELRRHCQFNISEGLELHDRLKKDGPEKTFMPQR